MVRSWEGSYGKLSGAGGGREGAPVRRGLKKGAPRPEPKSDKMGETEPRTGLLDQPVSCGSRGKTSPIGTSQALPVNSNSLFNVWHWAKVLNSF